MNKTKFFSSLLAVALFATAGVLTSCKDYDDDIKNLQTQIDGKTAKADLESLKSELTSQLTTAEASLKTAIAAKADASTETVEAAAEEGKVLNIYAWNEEFKSRLTDHYKGYEEVDATHGKIGDIDVVWNITPSDDNAYQNNLDETLLKQDSAAGQRSS